MVRATLTKARHSAQWVHNAIIYELYFRSFTPEGTIRSALKRIPALKSLGVTVIWLMPIHPIGLKKRKGSRGSPYAVKDYFGVNPEYGTLNDLQHFIHTAHSHGLHVIMDLVIGHAAHDNDLIEQHPDWFRRKHRKFLPPLPEWSDVVAFDYRKKELHGYMMNVMHYWITEIGFDGFRCDVANHVPLHFWERARNLLDQTKSILLLSETDHTPSHHRTAFDLSYSTSLYNTVVSVLHGRDSAVEIQKIISNEKKRYPVGSLLLRFTSNHDRNVEDGSDISVFGTKGARLAAVVVNTVPGIPLIYNGQEFGSTKQLSLFERTTIPVHRNKIFFQFYQTLFDLRKRHAALSIGNCIFLSTSAPSAIIAFVRSTNSEKIVVLLNCSREKMQFKVNFSQLKRRKTSRVGCDDIVTGKNFQIDLAEDSTANFILAGLEWKIFRWKA